ncbi:MAG: HAD family phosphatase [Candidatus Omnitrophica bacterium]|nr:HAD family phosphatase [Candidatus Omnitrophota bacterium]
MPFHTIFFDLGRVLVDFDQDVIAKRLIERSTKTFSEALAFYRETNIIHNFEMGRLGPDEVLSAVNECFGLSLGMEEFKSLWSDIFFVNQEMEKMVDLLKDRYHLLIISDTNVLHYEHIVRHFPVVRKFEDHILSFKVGARKPDPRIFKAALGRAGCRASEAIFIDDKENNVKGARRLGMTGIVHRSVEKTRRALKRLGVLS